MGKRVSVAVPAMVAVLLAGWAHAETSVMLSGERPAWSSARKITVSDMVASASVVLGSRCVDRISTSPELLAQTAQRLAAEADVPPVVVIFTGMADEKAGTAEGSVRDALTSLATTLAKRKAVGFVVPSQPTLGASVSGTLRVGAGQVGLNFVEPGTEIMGHPYDDAMGEIRKSLAEPIAPATAPAAAATSTTAPAPAPMATPTTVSAGLSPATTATAVSTATPLPAPPVRSLAGSDSATTAGTKDKVTSHTVVIGPGATPVTINMTSPPPLKAFDPKSSLNVKRQGGKGKKRPAVER